MALPALPRRWYTALTLFLGLLVCGYAFRRFNQDIKQPQYVNPDTGPRFPPLHVDKLPTAKVASLPKVQFNFPAETDKEKHQRLVRQGDVRELFQRAWAAYKEHAYGADELKPISGVPDSTFGGWGATLVDSLDTLWIMGMKAEFEEAVSAVAQIDFRKSEQKVVNVFETTIRYLGGLLGAYDISGGAYPVLLTKAIELGDLLYQAFDTPQRIPVSRWEWLKPGQMPSDYVIVAELGSLTLEFTRLTQLTSDSKYYDAVYRVMQTFEFSQEETRVPGLWPTIIDAQHLKFSGTHFTIGGMSDSLYEYLPKQYILLGGTVPSYKNMYKSAFTAMKDWLFMRPVAPDRKWAFADEVPDPVESADILFPISLYIGNEDKFIRDPQAQHLSCFAGGMVALAAKTFKTEAEDMPIAKKLVDGCIWAYEQSPLGIMPEVSHLVPCDHTGTCNWDENKWKQAVLAFGRQNGDGDVLSPKERTERLIIDKRLKPGFADIKDKRYILRPEAIESVFVLYRITGEKYLLDAAWGMLNSIKPATWTKYGNAAVADVTVEPKDVQQLDLMESFWFAETLKYFYLIYSEPSLVSLDDYVFNTEAHTLKRPKAGSVMRKPVSG